MKLSRFFLTLAIFSCSWLNASASLASDGDGAGGCNHPTAVITAPMDDTLRICPGQIITFDGSGSFTEPGQSIVSYAWDFGNGSTADAVVTSHAFDVPGQYSATLTVTDDLGCASINAATIVIQVAPFPNFSGMTAMPHQLCFGDTIFLNGPALNNDWSSGLSFHDSDTIVVSDTSTYMNGQVEIPPLPGDPVIDSPSDIKRVCLVMEHSYIGDLVIHLLSPAGDSVALFGLPPGNGPVGTYLGDPDDGTDDNIPGVGWQYCFADPGDLAFISIENAAQYWTTSTITPRNSMIPGEYTPIESYAAWMGSPVSGSWTLAIEDRFAIDNGFVFDWWIELDSSLVPNDEYFSVTSGEGCDSSFWSSVLPLTDTGIGCDDLYTVPTQPGTWSFTYQMLDGFGCAWDSTLSVDVASGAVSIQVLGDTSSVQCIGDITLLASGAFVYYWYLDGSYEAQGAELVPEVTGTYQVIGQGVSCEDSSETVFAEVIPPPDDPIVIGDIVLVAGSTENYTAVLESGLDYLWTVSGGTITSDSSSMTVEIHWGTPGTGWVCVTQAYEACSTDDTLFVQIGPNGFDELEHLSLTIRPNPTGSYLNLSCTTCEGLQPLIITDALGRSVLRLNAMFLHGKAQLDLNTLSIGTYALQVQDAKGATSIPLIIAR